VVTHILQTLRLELAQRDAKGENSAPAAKPVRNPAGMYQALPPEVQVKITRQRFAECVSDEGSAARAAWTLIRLYTLLIQDADPWTGISQITWVGTATMLVSVSSGDDYKRLLEKRGFRDEWWARDKDKGDLWGLRKTVAGLGLHIRGKSNVGVEIHLDSTPPTWTTFAQHKIIDDWLRGIWAR
jgi:hypothetical protein